MNETKVRAYIELKNSNLLGDQQRMVLRIIKKKPRTRQSISHATYLELATVCGRVNELIHKKLVVVDNAIGNREVLRIRYKWERVNLEKVSSTQMDKWKTTFDIMTKKQKQIATKYVAKNKGEIKCQR